MLTFKNVSKSYKNSLFDKTPFHALTNVSFKIEKGETVGIYGKSGSGKTTIGRIALKLAAPSSGTVYFNNKNITEMSEAQFRPLRPEIQILFQHPEEAFNPLMTLRQSIFEAYKKIGIPKKQRPERLEKDLETFRLPMGLMERYPSQVSGGEIQRAVLIRVLSFKPDLLVMDEPTSMLDVSEQAHILQLIRQFQKELNMGVMLISHDPYIIRAMCSRIITISGGRITGDFTADRFDEFL